MTSASAPAINPVVRFEPEPSAWPQLTNQPINNRALTDERASATRLKLGLDPNKPVMMSGHQPTLWHPGILAKRQALKAYARAHNAQAVWLVVDQDAMDPWAIEVPIQSKDGSMSVRAARLAPEPKDGTPACALPAASPSLQLPEGLDASMRGRLERAASAIGAHTDAPNASVQVERATASLLGGDARAIYASSLRELPVFDRLLDTMLEDPAKCAQAYNLAVDQHGGARPLSLRTKDDWELPLWKLDGQRTPVFAGELASIDRATLAPKALLMTALLRLEACDVFIHGTGGGATDSSAGYDRATEAWIADWLGAPLAPSVVVTADLRLDLEDGQQPSERELQRIANRAHTARHNPGQLGENAAQREKLELVRAIEAVTDRHERSALYRKLHALLAEHRGQHASEIDSFEAEAHTARMRVASAQVAAKRDWSFALYPQESIDSLRSAVEEAFK